MYEPSKSDWKKYSALVPDVRERYLQKHNAELANMLLPSSQTPTEQFGATFERFKEISKILTTCLDHHSRSRMLSNIYSMYHCGMISDQDLEPFSEELHTHINGWKAIVESDDQEED